MAGYISEDMRLMGGVPGQQLFLYRTEDAVTTISAEDYFNQAVEDYNLDTGDIIIACTGPSQADAINLLVATNTGGAVSVINGN
ncbi:hypothetical protein [Pseudodesulfovibrio piezophilus]|uniref:Uncharacterized protein n=1 Tax=Pseudodesulfovibrio piezophilus (strain DSM 21447 / JCM 15486 / C1TLV30) TaxID=1322246 RepID=M1WTI3_PSEP2|nr:hypothetical protein [Pseudodesulfovibrio piezophilus]CCH49607.1 conserved protein of unknown function [Pseudodesulfovibrio piezophilus C1TLV30]